MNIMKSETLKSNNEICYNNKKELSIVIPVYNESGNLEELHNRLLHVLEELNKDYEIIFINDGSQDDSLDVLKNIQKNNERIVIINFRRNFGQTAAFAAGFDHASGDIIVTMDSDLENSPEDIPKLLTRIEEGYDLVSGWRINRKDNYLLRILPSKIANYIISFICGIKLHDYGCSLKAYRSEILQNIKLYGEMHRFIPALASIMGISAVEIPVEHVKRTKGKSNYNILRFVKVILDLILIMFLLNYTSRPFHIFGFLGISSFTIGFIVALYLSVLKIFYEVSLSARPLLLMSVVLIIFGIQLITMGLLSELIIRNYYESQNKTVYIVKEVISSS